MAIADQMAHDPRGRPASGSAPPRRVVPLFPATKFLPPPARPEHVLRERCLRLTSGPLAARHLLISASAGAGKSTLAAQWAAGVGPTAWVSLAAADDDPGQLWAAVITALRTVSPGFGTDALPALLGGADTRSVLVRLVDEAAELEGEVALVLDDLHAIRSRECHEDLTWLLSNAPPNLRLCLCTREDPSLPVHRLVARGLLTDLHGDELAFDASEADEFMRERLELEIDEETARDVGARVEGWAAGLYLAALSLRAGTSATELFSGLETGDRRVRDYIQSEALARLDEPTLLLLESLAVLPRFCAELCDAVLERSDSRARLAELDASNLFVIPLDRTGTWFRLHHLFARVLVNRAETRDAERVRKLHRRAAAWHRDRGDIGEAISHFAEAREYDEAGELIAASIPLQINISRLAGTLASWLDLLPAELVESRAPLCLGRAWVAAINSRREEAERWVERAKALPHEGPLPSGSASAAAEAALLQATFCFKDYEAGRRHCVEAVELESPDSPWQPLLQMMRGWYAYTKEDGQEELALASYARSEELATLDVQVASVVIAPAVAAVVHAERGDLAAADAAARRSDEARRAAGVQAVPQMLNSWFGTARAHRALGRLEQAAQDAEAGAAIAADYPPERDSLLIAVPVMIELGRIRMAQGDREGAQDALADARARLDGAVDAGRITDWLEAAEQELRGGFTSRSAVEPDARPDLSERELAVLRMLAGTATLREIGGELYVSVNTLKTHCRAIYRKLGVSSREEAVARARELDLLVRQRS